MLLVVNAIAVIVPDGRSESKGTSGCGSSIAGGLVGVYLACGAAAVENHVFNPDACRFGKGSQ